jgi:hypothetical protein
MGAALIMGWARIHPIRGRFSGQRWDEWWQSLSSADCTIDTNGPA